MKISITTDDGEVVDILKAEDIGDLRFPMARADLMEQIRQSWIKASAMEEGRQPTPSATQVEVSPEAACAAEFGYRCGEKGMNVQAMQEELAKVMKVERA